MMPLILSRTSRASPHHHRKVSEATRAKYAQVRRLALSSGAIDMIGMHITHASGVSGLVDAVSVMADGLAIARVCDRWIPVDELAAV